MPQIRDRSQRVRPASPPLSAVMGGPHGIHIAFGIIILLAMVVFGAA